MTTLGRRGDVLSDHHLVTAVSTSRITAFEAAGRRVYTATFENRVTGAILTRTFAVGHAEAARTYAREYAARILPNGPGPGTWIVRDCRWAR